MGNFKVSAAIKNTINFQTKLTLKSSGINPQNAMPACVITGSADTCDFRIRIWNQQTGGTATAGNNLMYEELFTNIELGDTNGILNLTINSVCGATTSATHQWGTTGASATVCNLFDDNGDADSTTGINFARSDLWLELTWDVDGTWTSLTGSSGNAETFGRINLRTAPSAFVAQTLNGFSSSDFVQLNPSAIQNTTSTNGAIRVNQTGTGTLLQLQTAGANVLTVNNTGQLGLSDSLPGYGFSRVVGGSGTDIGQSVYVSPDGTGVYQVGTFTGTSIDLDGTGGTDPFTSSGTGLYLTKYNASGAYQWSRVISTTSGTQQVLSVAATDTDVYYCGAFSGTQDFNGNAGTDSHVSAGGTDNFIIKYNSSGTYQWGKHFGGSTAATTEQCSAIAVDSSGNSYITGRYNGTTVDFNPGAGTDNHTSSGDDAYFAKYDTTGAYLFGGAFGGSGNTDIGKGIAVTTDGFFYFGGGFVGASIDFDTTAGTDSQSSFSSGTANSAYISKYTTAGVYAWTRVFAGHTTGGVGDQVNALVASTTSVYAAGSFGNTTDFDGTAGTDTKSVIGGSADGFLVKYNSDASYGWARTFGSEASDSTNSLSIDSGGSLYIGTGASGVGAATDFDGTSTGFDNKVSVGSNDVYFSKYYPNGNYAWTVSIGAAGLDNPAGIYANGTDIYAVGAFQSSNLDFDFTSGTDVKSTAGSNDSFLVKFTQTVSGGISIGGGLIYRSASGVLTSNYSLEIALDSTFNGLSNFAGNMRSLVTIANGSTTATGTGSSTRNLVVASTTNFDIGNLVFLNGTTYARIDSIDSATQMTVTPALSWSNGQTVVEYTAPTVGGDGQTANLNQQFDSANIYNYLRAGGDANGTSFGDRNIVAPRGLRIEGSTITSTGDQLNITTTNGLIINTTDAVNVTASWSTGKAGGTARSRHTSILYNGKIYSWGGTTGSVINTLDIYDIATNTWSTGTAGGTARQQHTSVVYNGKIYSWGGLNSGGTALNTVDIYDIATDAWTTGTAGGTARSQHSAIVYSGKMYSWGGLNSGGTAINTLDIYDFVANSWTTGTAGGTARYQSTSNLYNVKIYNWAGLNSGGTAINTLDIYNIATDTWSTGTAGGTARALHTSAVYGGKIYSWAGTTGSLINTVDIYSFATDAWTTGVTGGTARSQHSAVLYDGKIYNWAGNTGSHINTMDIYDLGDNSTVLQVNVGSQEKLKLDTNNILTVTGQALGLVYPLKEAAQYTSQAWTTGATGGTARTGAAGAQYNNKWYLWGGSSSSALTTKLNTMDIYDFLTNTWTTGTAGGTARDFHQAQVYNGKIYFVTGCTNNLLTANTTVVDIYDIVTDSWSTGTSGGTGRCAASSVLYNGKIYIWAGYTGSNLNSLDIYDINANSWSTGAAGGTARRFQTAVLYNGKMYNFGGFIAAVTNTVDIYDFQTNTWAVGTSASTVRELHGFVPYNGKFYAVYGFTSAAVNTVEIFDTERAVWSIGLAGGTARYEHVSTVYSGKIYNWSGLNSAGTTVLNTLDIFDIGASKSEDVFYITNQQNGGPDNGKLFRFDAAGRAYTSKQGGWFSVGADYAEYMHVKDATIEPGDIVKLDSVDAKSLIKTSKANDNDVIGVISTDPGFVGNITNIEDINNNRTDMKLLSMVGQVPVKVSTENGEIKIGDPITSSSVPGVGMKADPGDSNIGLAQENYSGNIIGKISVLITRNNEGINNKVQISLGENGEAGFRLNNSGNLQFKDTSGNWKDIAQSVEVDNSMIWEKIGDNIFNNSSGVTSIGVDEENLSGSKLQISQGIDVMDGLKFVKITANGVIKIGESTSPLSIRLNETTGGIEYSDAGANDWRSLSGMVISRMQVNNENVLQVQNSYQISGWGFLKGDGSTTSLSKEITIPGTVREKIAVLSNIIGYSENEPNNPTQCDSVLDQNIVSKVNIKSDNKFDMSITTNEADIPNKYICFNWIAIAN
ncbi:MAG: kelch repeat-containing protein [Candidatus Dojkabacteria bacterium]